jgi:hypothetical protein
MRSLPGDMINMSKLKRLGLFFAKIVKMDSRFCEFQNIVPLQLYRCNMLEDLSVLHNLKGLKQLYIFSCSKLKKFPIEFSEKRIYPTTIYESPTNRPGWHYYRSGTQNLHHLQFFPVYILHPKLPRSTIHSHIETWFSFRPQIIF